MALQQPRLRNNTFKVVEKDTLRGVFFYLTSAKFYATMRTLIKTGVEMKKIILFLILLNTSCVLEIYDHPFYDKESNYCYEIQDEYPIDCWRKSANVECCEWVSSPHHCIDVWCMRTDDYQCNWKYNHYYCY